MAGVRGGDPQWRQRPHVARTKPTRADYSVSHVRRPLEVAQNSSCSAPALYMITRAVLASILSLANPVVGVSLSDRIWAAIVALILEGRRIAFPGAVRGRRKVRTPKGAMPRNLPGPTEEGLRGDTRGRRRREASRRTVPQKIRPPRFRRRSGGKGEKVG